MTAWLLGLAAGWSVLGWSRVDRRWPWRVARLVPPAVPDPARRRRTDPARRSMAVSRRPGVQLRRDRRDRTVLADLLVAIDLLAVALSAGHTIHTAVSAVGRLEGGPAVTALGQVDAAVARGHSLVDALGELETSLGPPARPLVTVLTAALRSGAPIAPALHRLADAGRRRQRRLAEARVRRLPVLMLAPLVGLVLPAFLILTIVPVAMTAARAGLLPASA